jgi:hypothetical protein
MRFNAWLDRARHIERVEAESTGTYTQPAVSELSTPAAHSETLLIQSRDNG